jgi:thiamine biosynthesis protein ThiS
LEIVFNGERREIAAGTTVAQLLAELGMQERHVAVEVNLQLVPRALHPDCRLAAGDRLEVVPLVGGG